MGMENGQACENNESCLGLTRYGSSELAEIVEENVVVNNSCTGNKDLKVLTKKKMDSLLIKLSRDKCDSVLLTIRIPDGLRYGIVKRDDSIVYQFSDNQYIKVNLVTRSFQECEGSEWKEASHEEGVIDLDVNGWRWEGGIKDERPYGYGILYDDEGRKEYEGFMMDRIRMCYGIEYYSDINQIKYDGCYYYNNRFGAGVLYDRNGVIEHDGLWKNDIPYSSEFDGVTMDNQTESIVIPEHSFNEVKSLVFPVFLNSLKRIDIGDDSFGNVRALTLTGLTRLERVRIGKRSFTHCRVNTEMFVEREFDGALEIISCPSLQSIEIDDFSFADFHLIDLKDLPSLQFIFFGSYCFHWSFTLSLAGTQFQCLIGRSTQPSICLCR